MQLSFAHLADYANVTLDQKLNVMGIFASLASASFPTVHPDMCVVVQLTARSPEYGRKFKVDVRLVDEDGTVIVPFEAELTVPHDDHGLPVNMNLIFRMVNTVLQKPGSYGVYILVDNDEKGSIPLDVIQITPPAV